MSRIGKKFIAIPEKVKIKLDGQKILVDGPKGSLSRILPSLVCCTMDDDGKNLFIDYYIITSNMKNLNLFKYLQ